MAPTTTSAPIRAHLMIGAAASGKSTVARILARLLSSTDRPPAQIISTRELRIELFGDRGVFGPWAQLEAVMNERIADALRSGAPVIVDATHARRPWRLAITQSGDPQRSPWAAPQHPSDRELSQKKRERQCRSLPLPTTAKSGATSPATAGN